jgi:hypothetical protein
VAIKICYRLLIVLLSMWGKCQQCLRWITAVSPYYRHTRVRVGVSKVSVRVRVSTAILWQHRRNNAQALYTFTKFSWSCSISNSLNVNAIWQKTIHELKESYNVTTVGSMVHKLGHSFSQKTASKWLEPIFMFFCFTKILDVFTIYHIKTIISAT